MHSHDNRHTNDGIILKRKPTIDLSESDNNDVEMKEKIDESAGDLVFRV